MRVIIQRDYKKMSNWTAAYIADAINRCEACSHKKPFVLGLPTGSSPVGTYKELIRMHKSGEVSFKNVVTFNMDEYVGLPCDHPQSYHSFMWDNLFSHIDIPRENVNIPDGNAADITRMCEDYEKKIASYGGIDLFLGGVGVDGHLAFNEPFSSLSSVTRVKTLTYDTRVVNSRFFDNDVSRVPTTAVTVGVKTVTDSKEVLLLVNGYNKGRALQAIVEGPVTHSFTSSILQLHPNAIIVCDEDATVELKVGTYKYFKEIEQEQLLH
ncbi:MAG: glucosamine-6-phosphate deaminase [Sphaerochaetaceae bacterium]|nr:glucosamine-6-phosphate deaminase [Sphaerochaetaceae bacterium]